jgi:sulfate adenylyltransferase
MKKINVRLLVVLLCLLSSVSAHTEALKITLTKRQLCDLELLMNGGFSPLQGFLNEPDYNNVVENMRLADGTLWPIPIILDVSQDTAQKICSKNIELRSPEGLLLATMLIQDCWKPDKIKEVTAVYGTSNPEHPGVKHVLEDTKEYYVGGPITKIAMPYYYDFVELRKTPAELKKYFKEQGYNKVIAFQTRNPMHRAHQELTFRAAKNTQAHLLLHPVVGLTKPGDIDHFTRVRGYKKLLKYYPEGSVTLSLLPLSMRMAGPREAVWHALIRKNYGVTHFIVGRDHAGPGKDSTGKDFYGPYDSQELVLKYAKEIGIEVVPFKEMVYLPDEDRYEPVDEIKPDTKTLTISGTQLRKLLQEGKPIPEWFSYPEVIQELQKTYPPRPKQGLTLFFTGLSGAGKSTLANALAIKLTELQNRFVTILDGDIIRTYLSSELGFSKEHRSLNVRRVGFVASEISKNGGIALCAMIAPYEQDRAHTRALVSARGGYIEIYLKTPLEICEHRDVKGLYAQARKGLIENFTGIDDPYEIPTNPEITIDTSVTTIDEAIENILSFLKKEHYL